MARNGDFASSSQPSDWTPANRIRDQVLSRTDPGVLPSRGTERDEDYIMVLHIRQLGELLNSESDDEFRTWCIGHDPGSELVEIAITFHQGDDVMESLFLPLTGGTLTGALTIGGHLDVGGFNITNVGTVDGLDISADLLRRDGSLSLTADWNVGGFDITNATSFAAYANNAATTRAGGMPHVIAEQDSTGDAAITLLLTGTREYQLYVDNSDSDKLKVRDVTAATDPIVVEAGAADSSIVVSTAGNVGVGVTPAAAWVVDVQRTVAGLARFKRADVGSAVVKIDTQATGAAILQFAQNNTAEFSAGHDDTSSEFRIARSGLLASNIDFRINQSDDVAIGGSSFAAQLHVNQPSATGAQPVLELDQDDADVEFIEWDGTSGANATSSISTWTLGNTTQGHLQITVNGTKRWLRFYDDPTM